jgi:hypothetical protein
MIKCEEDYLFRHYEPEQVIQLLVALEPGPPQAEIHEEVQEGRPICWESVRQYRCYAVFNIMARYAVTRWFLSLYGVSRIFPAGACTE